MTRAATARTLPGMPTPPPDPAGTRPTKTPKPSVCPTCQAPTLVVRPDDGIWPTQHHDPNPLTPLGELQALLLGRDTYEHHAGTTWRRDGAQLRTRKPTRLTVRVHPVHACGAPPLDHYPPQVDPDPNAAPPY